MIEQAEFFRRLMIICILTAGICISRQMIIMAAEGADEGWETEEAMNGLDSFDLSQIQEFLNQQSGSQDRVNFTGIMEDLMAGRFQEVLDDLGTAIKDSLFSEIKNSSKMMAQIIVLGLIGAVFSNFSSIFTSSQISETGFFVTYLLLFTFLASSFFASISIAGQVVEAALQFMKVLMPAYFLAVAFAGGSMTSVAVYEFTLGMISIAQWLIFTILIPMVRIYILFVLAGHIAKEDVLSKLTELIHDMIIWSLKTMVGIVLGFHLVQGMVLPYVDSMKNTTLQKLVGVIPGIGQGANAVTQIIMGSGVLIKNTMGAAAVVILLILTAIPVIKLVIMMLLYQLVAAVLQPVCDKRIVSCVSCVAQGHKLLLKIVMTAMLLFVITVAIVCVGTNVTYYAG